MLSNGGYLQSKELMEERKNRIEDIRSQADELVMSILVPESVVTDEDLQNNPFFRAGLQGLEKTKWESGMLG